MTDKKGYTQDFNSILNLRETYNDRKAKLIAQTEANEIWDIIMSPYNFEELSVDTIIQTIDTCFSKAYKKIADSFFNIYCSTLLTSLHKDYYKNWNLIQQIEDGILPEKMLADYNELYVKALPGEKKEFDSSPAAVELRQLQEEWRKLAKTSYGDFSNIDWSVSKNRSQFCKWLDIFDSETLEVRFFLDEFDYSDCYNYEDFCLNAPYWMIYNDGFLVEKGLLSNLEFLLAHSDEFSSYAILEFAIDNLSSAISEYPEKMLVILKEDGDSFPEKILKAVEENFPDIPDNLRGDYQTLFNELKEYC